MSSHTDDDAGPDLSQGVTLTDFGARPMLRGHVADQAVLLVRVGEEILAVDAACTHYGGPLAEGIVVGETVRCPWHHACFSLRTGEALGAPAFDALACWRVERLGERIVVRERAANVATAASGSGAASVEGVENVASTVGAAGAAGAAGATQPTRAARPAIDGPKEIVVVGGGAAGFACAEMLRRRGYGARLTLLSDDADAPCDRPNLSKDYLAGNAPEEWIPLRSGDFYTQNNIDLQLRSGATRIDTAQRTVTLADSRVLPFDRLLLATGAEPVRPPIPGAGEPHVFALRTLADSRAIALRAKVARSAVVLGSGFIGLEAAAALRARGLQVQVVSLDARPLEKVLGPELGDFIRALHESHGVVFHMGASLASIKAQTVVLTNGSELAADLVIIGVGVRPRTVLAEAAGLAVDRGILVDASLQTSVAGIYAAGDVARWRDAASGLATRIEHWVVAERHGQVVAENMLGAGKRFQDAPFFWSAHYDVTIRYVGHAASWDAIEVEGSIVARDCLVSYFKDGRRVAVAAIGRDAQALEFAQALQGSTGGG